MATVTVKFDADTSAAKKQLADLQAAGQQAQQALAEGKPGDRRAALETLRTAKETLATAEKEKAEVQAKVKAQAQAVREAQAAVNAAKEGTSAHATAAKELERQQKAFERIKQLANIKGQTADQALLNVGMARRVTQIPVAVDPLPAKAALQKVETTGRTTAQKIGDAFGRLRGKISGTLSGLKGLAIGGAIVMGLRMAQQAATALVAELDKVVKASRSYGLDTDSFQELSYAAKSAGVPLESVTQAMGRAQKTIGEAAAGSTIAQLSLARLGLSVEELKNLRPAEQFDRIAAAINAIPDQSEKAAAAMRIFGRSGAQLLDFLSSYKARAQELRDMGGIVDPASLEAAEAMTQAVANLGTALKAAIANLPAFRQLAAAMGEAAYYWPRFANGTLDQAAEEAAKKGTYNRKTGVNYAIEHARRNGLVSDRQLALMRKFADLYAGGTTASNSGTESAYKLIDQALGYAGLGALARKGGNWDRSAATATLPPTAADFDQAAQEARELEQFKRKAAVWAAEQQKKQDAEDFRTQLALSTGTATPEQRRQAAIDEEITKMEQLAAKYGQVLSAEQRSALAKAAGAKWDEKQDKASLDLIASLKERYRLQQLIAAGKGREAAIEERLAEARKRAAEAGRELAPGEEQEIRGTAGGLYDLQHKQSATGPGRIGADSYATYGLRSVGGLIEGASRVGTMADYPRQTAEAVKALETKVNEIYGKLPERTETGTTRIVF